MGYKNALCFKYSLSLYCGDNESFSKVQGKVENRFRDWAQASLIRVVGTNLQANTYKCANMKESSHFSKSATSILPHCRDPTNNSDGRAWEIVVQNTDRRPLPCACANVCP